MNWIYIGKSVNSIGNGAYNLCYSLKNNDIDENNMNFKTIDEVLYSKDEMSLIYYQSGEMNNSYIILNHAISIN